MHTILLLKMGIQFNTDVFWLLQGFDKQKLVFDDSPNTEISMG